LSPLDKQNIAISSVSAFSKMNFHKHNATRAGRDESAALINTRNTVSRFATQSARISSKATRAHVSMTFATICLTANLSLSTSVSNRVASRNPQSNHLLIHLFYASQMRFVTRFEFCFSSPEYRSS
jgi:hypothetical protein